MFESSLEIRRISTEETYPLRLKVLRPGGTLSDAMFAEDGISTHFGAFLNGALVGIASIVPQNLEGEARPAWRLRGMATNESVRGRGVGAQLLAGCLDFARSQSAQYLWCNARTEASGFYLKQGFAILSDEFDIPTVGPHYVMGCAL